MELQASGWYQQGDVCWTHSLVFMLGRYMGSVHCIVAVGDMHSHTLERNNKQSSK